MKPHFYLTGKESIVKAWKDSLSYKVDKNEDTANWHQSVKNLKAHPSLTTDPATVSLEIFCTDVKKYMYKVHCRLFIITKNLEK